MNAPSTYIRQPIVSVLGHVDHGKTTLLDYIRGSTVAARESGAITQHIGATEVPIDAIHRICGELLGKKKFTVPGLLFIDTPGHHAFTTLRARGGSLADLAVLIVDITEGFRPQTHESINILRQYKTPFIVAANKVDRINGWQTVAGSTQSRIEQQTAKVRGLFEERLYELIGKLYDKKFEADLYYNVKDFRKMVPIIPISSLNGEGVPELLMVLVGLAQRFLEVRLSSESGPGKGTVLEVKEDVGLGTTADTIIYSGTVRKDDIIIFGTRDEPLVTKIKALLKPRPLDEIRDPRERFDSVSEVHAACGIKISAPDLDDVMPGAPLRVIKNNKEELIAEIKKQSQVDIALDATGIFLKADAVGSLEALAKESHDKGVQIRKAEIGNVSKRDIIEANAITDPLDKVIFAFNVRILPEAKDELVIANVKLFDEDVIYTIMEKYDVWLEEKKAEMDRQRRQDFIHPGMLRFLPEYIFRLSHPAIIGVRVLAGRIKVGMRLMRDDGKIIGTVKGIQSENRPVEEALQGQEIAISIEGVTVGRQIKGDDILYTVIPETDAKKLKNLDLLTSDEKEVLYKIYEINRKENKFWGM
ncbi:MAG: translation initiation factor IF-2 [Candidatus Thermoplasmatota archaeon]|nr:translation initiation factor IF-2 [Candidatus Thermoplasmatota archaeon]MBU1941795.1 translation initiation factor IF-2 [Candidatus Thermoplasmatota archaeon]